MLELMSLVVDLLVKLKHQLWVYRAILSISEDFKSVLRANGLLTQDRERKERKKYGKRGARKSPQFRKR